MQKIIKQIRAYLNISQTEFAEQLNVTFQTVNRWENGRALPNKLAQSKMFDLCRVLRDLLSPRAESNVTLAKASIWGPIPVRRLR